MIPAVSIIMPVYNAAPFLRAAIDSILGQSYKDFELILINDGSKDHSEEIIRSYSDTRIRYFAQANAGVAATLNRGVGLARGEYIWRHDADDISLPSKLERQVRFLDTHPEYVLCAVQVAFMTERGKTAWGFKQPDSAYFNGGPFLEVERKHFAPYSPITHGTVLMRTAAVRELGGYRPEFITGEDVDLWLRMIQGDRAVVLNECLSLHRLNKNSATRKHGWKNEFFRNLAFRYYEQRLDGGMDDLQAGKSVVLPAGPADEELHSPKGMKYRGDLLLYLYPLHLNARDWKGMAEIARYALADGWKLGSTWRGLLFPLLGQRLVKAGVWLKQFIRGTRKVQSC